MILPHVPAFPVAFKNLSNVVRQDPFGDPIPPGKTVTYSGMTMFDYMAISAMQGLLASDIELRLPASKVAELAFEQAMAMVKEASRGVH